MSSWWSVFAPRDRTERPLASSTVDLRTSLRLFPLPASLPAPVTSSSGFSERQVGLPPPEGKYVHLDGAAHWEKGAGAARRLVVRRGQSSSPYLQAVNYTLLQKQEVLKKFALWVTATVFSNPPAPHPQSHWSPPSARRCWAEGWVGCQRLPTRKLFSRGISGVWDDLKC